MAQPEMFEPALYSLEELQFLLDHLEETPTVALYDAPPKGVNPVAIKTALGRFVELSELEAVHKQPWSGYAPVREAIERFLKYQEQCLEWQKQGEPRHPSTMTFDAMGAQHRGGIGADSERMVRSELLPNGDRIPFGVQLTGIVRPSRVFRKAKPAKAAPVAAEPDTVDEITHDSHRGVLTCTICDKVVATYDTDKGSRAVNKAIAEARKHCVTAKTEPARHTAIVNVPIV